MKRDLSVFLYCNSFIVIFIFFCPGQRKRRREQEHLTVLREMQISDVEQMELNRAQRERHLQMALDDAAHAIELEAALRREEIATMSSFNQAFLGTLSQLVQAIQTSCLHYM